jgi:hypothetical protein
MTPDEIIQQLERYRFNLVEIMGRYVRGNNSYRIRREDDPIYRTFIIEIIDLLNDSFGKNKYSLLINNTFMDGTNNMLQTPSYKSVEDIVSVIDSAITRIKRNPDFNIKKEEQLKPIEPEKPSEEEIVKKRVADRTDLTVTDLLFSSNYKVKLLVGVVFLAGLGIGVSFGASKLYKEKIIPLIDLYKTQDIYSGN